MLNIKDQVNQTNSKMEQVLLINAATNDKHTTMMADIKTLTDQVQRIIQSLPSDSKLNFENSSKVMDTDDPNLQE